MLSNRNAHAKEGIGFAKEGYGLGKPEGWDDKQSEGCNI